MNDVAPLLHTTGLAKAFGHVEALTDVDIHLVPGEVVALVGDNGAGKSTFVKILSGVYEPDRGTIAIDGEPVSFDKPADALAAGIATVYQDLALVDSRSVAANLFLGRELVRGPLVARQRMHEEAAVALRNLGIDIPSTRVEVGLLSGGQRQAVAIARAVLQGGRIMVMDEPTAALGVRESERILQLISDLRSAGRGIIVVSHNLQHIWEVADRIVVFHRGRLAGDRRRTRTTVEEIVQLILTGGNGAVTTSSEAAARERAEHPASG